MVDPAGTTNTLVRANPGQAWSTLTTGVTKQPLAADIHRSTVADGPAASHATAASYNASGEPSATPAHQPTLGYRSETSIEGLTTYEPANTTPPPQHSTTTDPLPGIPGTTTLNNPYHYTDNDPLNAIDPSGLRPPSDADVDPAVTARAALERRLRRVLGICPDIQADSVEYVDIDVRSGSLQRRLLGQ
ncbi:MAG: hypothetical protein M5U19_00385 [Microthrixaceae bacterium]|nr:hypothetical protein [Microthrixaceae bacterium]